MSANAYGDQTGQTSCKVCDPGTLRTFETEAPKGFKACVACPAGKMQASVVAYGSSSCSNCKAGQYQEQEKFRNAIQQIQESDEDKEQLIKLLELMKEKYFDIIESIKKDSASKQRQIHKMSERKLSEQKERLKLRDLRKELTRRDEQLEMVQKNQKKFMKDVEGILSTIMLELRNRDKK